MSKTEYAWVIQRDDEKYCVSRIWWTGKLCNATFVDTLQDCEKAIKQMNLQNCRPVKVKISIVGEDDE